MLTRCYEKGREKCDQYWPDNTTPMFYGDIRVELLNESKYVDWSTTEFMICRGSEQRRIRHYHFITWPDFGVPSPPQTLVRFVRAFRDRVGPDQRPIVVHCSAGVGRSGTFITLDRILQQIQVSHTVDIFGIVWAMRKGKGSPSGELGSWNNFFRCFLVSQNVFGWSKRNNNTFVFINVCGLCSKAKRICVVHHVKYTITKATKVSQLTSILTSPHEQLWHGTLSVDLMWLTGDFLLIK